MKTFSEIAYKVAKLYGFESIESLLLSEENVNYKQDFMYDLTIEVQKECLKNAYSNINTEDVNCKKWGNIKRGVESEDNIIK